MSSDEHFIELWNDYLEGELDESGIAQLQTLVEQDDRLLRMAADSYQIHRLLGLIAQDSASRHEDFVRETLARLPADDDRFVDRVMQHLPEGSPRRGTTARIYLARWSAAVAAVAVVALAASLYFQRPSTERRIAKITGLSGSLQWTGDGGRVFHDLRVGTELPGGTIEGMVPGSWFELEFNDGSTVTISGNSTLTFSDHEQKKLHLKEGSVSGNVKPQPPGRPMLIYTRSAMLEVLGTQFEVEAGLSVTMLNVSEGKVRVKRLSDGSTIDVPAKHRLIAAADQEMLPVPVPDVVGRWKSQLHLGPVGTLGKWSPGRDAESAKLRAVPFTTPQGKTIYTAAFGISHGDRPPVALQSASRLRVRGRIASTHDVYFGVTVRHAGGGFAGNFQTIRPAVEFPSGQDFEVILHLRDLQLDPSLIEMKNKLPTAPFDLVVESFWCHTLNEQVGLEVTEVELIPSVEDE
ncbi:MAG: FecR domain-containing protein [Phycisphaerales bacterium]|nr:MAG: FecR domain-containing protein [Phycisphaerales bacterium]